MAISKFLHFQGGKFPNLYTDVKKGVYTVYSFENLYIRKKGNYAIRLYVAEIKGYHPRKPTMTPTTSSERRGSSARSNTRSLQYNRCLQSIHQMVSLQVMLTFMSQSCHYYGSLYLPQQNALREAIRTMATATHPALHPSSDPLRDREDDMDFPDLDDFEEVTTHAQDLYSELS